jgi:uncharacterized SAM-binding protein YcdF (DUF218 family)
MPETRSSTETTPGLKQRIRLAMAAGVAVVGFPVWVTSAVLLERDGHRADPDGNWDAIVVAGCRVMFDGRPSLALVRRTEKAVQLWRAGRAPVIVLTGGVGRWPPSEAEAAARVARSLGVPDASLVLEERSTNTEQNARYARKLVSGERIIVVSDTYHVRRCEWFFRRHFQHVTGVGVVSPFAERASGAFRESIAYAYYSVRSARFRQ